MAYGEEREFETEHSNGWHNDGPRNGCPSCPHFGADEGGGMLISELLPSPRERVQRVFNDRRKK